MAKNITLMGADYPQVPAVQLPQTGGGTATFYDINVVDNLNSESETDALSANQGRVLNEKITSIGTGETLVNQNAAITTAYAYTGVSFTLEKASIVSVSQGYSNALPTAVGVKAGTSAAGTSFIYAENAAQEESVAGLWAHGVLPAGTYYVWAKAKAAVSNGIRVDVYPIHV